VEVGPVLAVAGVIAGIVAGERSGASSAGAVLVVGATAVGAAWFAHAPGRTALAVVACALLGHAAMGRALDGQEHSPLGAAIAARTTVTVHGTVVSDPTGPAYESDVVLRVDVGGGRHRTLLARATGTEVSALRVVEAGDRVAVRGRLAPLGSGSFDTRARWRHAVGRIDHAELVALAGPRGLFAAANGARTLIVRGTGPLAPTSRALVTGFLLGDTRSIPLPVIDAYRSAGLSHLLAVSGENVAFVMALAAPFLRRLRLGPRTACALAIVTVFAAMTRFEPSVLRAAAMAAITLLAMLGGRPVSGLRVLAYAVIVLLLADPFLLHSVAFALSCGASAGIACLSGPVGARVPGPRWVREPLAVSISAQLGVLPVLLLVFGSFPLVTPVSNLLAAPAAEVLGVYGCFACVATRVVPRLGPLLQQPTALLVAWITTVARTCGAVPFTLDRRGAVATAALAASGASVACLVRLERRGAAGRPAAKEPD
jgi:competence protein ComEC